MLLVLLTNLIIQMLRSKVVKNICYNIILYKKRNQNYSDGQIDQRTNGCPSKSAAAISSESLFLFMIETITIN